ncbi:GNAT family N-acetyltransferase [Cohnella thailandensis]|uniref:GNAT family N-acetyltransferase n=1 Tax=Cohnella thailandensis TaxID=557557 RepID=A0A841T745_9BACL|nr:GNAT family N-acetyltransferase [Cohnella thailandensis]MBP1973126.1 GNAT superfamily N-acetyltransferase [Cohnella thailandensis]
MNDSIIIKPISSDRIPEAHVLETLCYPPDQAAALEAFRYRQATFPDFFLGAWDGEELVGLACGVRTDAKDCTDVGIKQRHGGRVDGRKLCILSVAVHPDYRQCGLGTGLLDRIVSLAASSGLSSVMLMSQRELVPWYEARGFHATGLVHSEHGGVDWHDMLLAFCE